MTSPPGASVAPPNPPGPNTPPLSLRPAEGEEPTDYFLELIEDTVEQLDPKAQGAFLCKFLKSLASVEVSESESLVHWQEILKRRRELSERLGRRIGLRTAAVDYFATGLLRNPILLEYDELKRLRQNAALDPLTGLYNRRLFDESLAKELSRSRRYQYPLTLLLFDLRNFKRANDSYGHAAGDALLTKLARACLETLRGSDYPCRIGGDEFAVVLPQSEGPSARVLAQRITQKFDPAIEECAPRVGVGLDHGAATFPENGQTPAELFEAADRDLYERKKRAHLGLPQAAEAYAQAAAPPEIAPRAATPAPAVLSRQQRRYERISLEGCDAYGILQDDFGAKVARVLDLGFGGVSFLLEEPGKIPDVFHARLHVPILPPAEYKVRQVYAQPLGEGLQRVGCCFAV